MACSKKIVIIIGLVSILSLVFSMQSSFRLRSKTHSVSTSNKLESIVEEYQKWARNAITHHDAKFIVMDTHQDAGFGNRVRPIIASIVFGMVTKRIVLVKWNTTPNNYPGTKLNNFFASPGYEWDYYQYGYITQNKTKTIRILEYGHNGNRMNAGQVNELLCEDPVTWKEDIIFVKSIGYYARGFYANPFTVKKMEHIPETIVKEISDVFLRPIDFISNEINSFVGTHFKNHFNIGIQIRAFNLMPNGKRRDGDGGYYETEADLYKMFMAVDDLTQKHQAKQTNVQWFIASDNEYAISLFKKWSNITIVHNTNTETNTNYRKTIRSAQAAVVDMWLLSKCDVLFTTFESSFGCTAASVGFPKACNMDIFNKTDHLYRCFDYASSEFRPLNAAREKQYQLTCMNSDVYKSPLFDKTAWKYCSDGYDT